MNCPTRKSRDAEIVLDYCAQSLPPQQAVEFEAHMAGCADCTRLVNAQREVWQSLETFSPVAVSPDFNDRLYTRIAEEQSAPGWKLWLRRVFEPAVPYAFWKPVVPLAAACAVVAVGLYVQAPKSPEPVQQVRVEKVDIEHMEQTLADLDILTPVAPSGHGSM